MKNILRITSTLILTGGLFLGTGTARAQAHGSAHWNHQKDHKHRVDARSSETPAATTGNRNEKSDEKVQPRRAAHWNHHKDHKHRSVRRPAASSDARQGRGNIH